MKIVKYQVCTECGCPLFYMRVQNKPIEKVISMVCAKCGDDDQFHVTARKDRPKHIA